MNDDVTVANGFEDRDGLGVRQALQGRPVNCQDLVPYAITLIQMKTSRPNLIRNLILVSFAISRPSLLTGESSYLL